MALIDVCFFLLDKKNLFVESVQQTLVSLAFVSLKPCYFFLPVLVLVVVAAAGGSVS